MKLDQIEQPSFDSKLKDEADESQDAPIAEEEQDDQLEEVKDVYAAAGTIGHLGDGEGPLLDDD